MQGDLHLFMGCMFAGKTTHMLIELAKYADIGRKVIVIRPRTDTRAENCHSSIIDGTKFHTITTTKLSETKIEEYDVVGVEEAHLFPDILETMRVWVKEYKKKFYVAGIDGSAELTEIKGVTSLIPIATSYQQFRAICDVCSKESGVENPASFSRRINKMTNTIEVGGKDKYIPVCGRHHIIP